MATARPAPVPEIKALDLCRLARNKAGILFLSEIHYMKALGAISNMYCLSYLGGEIREPVCTTDALVSCLVPKAAILQEIRTAAGPRVAGKQERVFNALTSAFDELFHQKRHSAVYLTGFGTFRRADANSYDLQVLLPMQRADDVAIASA